MKSKIIIRLLLLVAVSVFLYSCVHDEILSSSDPASKEYENKSLWKEDEKYIKNVMQVYYENETKIKKTSGNPFWDYAATMDRFDESFLMVPVVENKKVVSVLQVPRHGKNIYFVYTNEANDIAFFQNIISARTKKALPNEVNNETSKLVCTTRAVSVWLPSGGNSEPGSGQGSWSTYHVTTCKNVQQEGCIGIVGPDGECTGGGGDGDPYPYPGGGGDGPQDPEEPEDPCAKTKSKIANLKFKEKYQELNSPQMFAMDHEKGYYERLPPLGSNLDSGFPVVDGAPCTHGMDLPNNEDGIAGLMHIHNDSNCDGNPSVKIPSPSDVRTFLNIFMKQARIYTGSYTNAYSVVITSQGSYMLQYTKDIWPGSTWDKLDDWNNWYVDKFERLTQDELSNPSIVEKIFTQFLKEKVAIDGLEVYKITENSSAKLEYSGTNQPVTATPCPQ